MKNKFSYKALLNWRLVFLTFIFSPANSVLKIVVVKNKKIARITHHTVFISFVILKYFHLNEHFLLSLSLENARTFCSLHRIKSHRFFFFVMFKFGVLYRTVMHSDETFTHFLACPDVSSQDICLVVRARANGDVTSKHSLICTFQSVNLIVIYNNSPNWWKGKKTKQISVLLMVVQLLKRLQQYWKLTRKTRWWMAYSIFPCAWLNNFMIIN